MILISLKFLFTTLSLAILLNLSPLPVSRVTPHQLQRLAGSPNEESLNAIAYLPSGNSAGQMPQATSYSIKATNAGCAFKQAA